MGNKPYILILALVIFWVASLHAGGGYQAPPDIVSTLPKYCWWQYIESIPYDAEEFRIIGCGANANHYCPGLVHMKLAEREKTTGEHLGRLRRAKEDIEYTLKNTETYPECPVRVPAKMNLERIKFQMDTLKWNPKKR